MKRILSFAVLLFLLLCSNYSKGQLFSGDGNKGKDSTQPKGEFGLKLGANTQSISGDLWDHSYSTGVTGGFWARMHKNKIGVRAEVLVSTFHINSGTLTDSSGNKYFAVSDSAGRQGKFSALYLDIPVILEYSIVPKLLLQAGIQYTNLVSLTNVNDVKGSFKTLFKQGEFSFVAGLEVKLPLNFSVGGRYKYGLSDINNTEVSLSPGTWKTNAFQLYVCYKIK